ncbi:sensor histidine kinase, partial [Acidithiobacillus sp.]|uniref:sensor histidine kinase n=1 Tax=Acidithiobacillus sp. TaxID=1872118 RepID=UPI003D08221E
LIDNAITHTPPRTAVMVVSGPGPMLSVRDHGPGIPAEKREVISRRFSHIRRDDSGGVGMGLAIAAAIMGAHGGTIQIRDAEGGGGVVELRFPE